MPQGPGTWDGTQGDFDGGTNGLGDGILSNDELKLAYYSFQKWAAHDRGHNTTLRFGAGAIAGCDESFIALWALMRMLYEEYPRWDNNNHMADQPRSAHFAIIASIVFDSIGGFSQADPDLVAEQLSYHHSGLPNGQTPLDHLAHILPRILSDRFTGGIGDGMAGSYLDSSTENAGSNNVLKDLCAAGKIEFSGDGLWFDYQGQKFFRSPCYGRYIWQSAMLLEAYAIAFRYYDWYLADAGVEPFPKALQDGLGEALDYYHWYIGEVCPSVGTSSAGYAPDTVPYNHSVDCYHNAADQASAGNPYGHRTKDIVTERGFDLGVFQKLRDAFVDDCNEKKWDETDPTTNNPIGWTRSASSPNKYIAWSQDSAKTAAWMWISSRALWFGWDDALVQRAVNGPSYEERTSDEFYVKERSLFYELYHALEEHDDQGGGGDDDDDDDDDDGGGDFEGSQEPQISPLRSDADRPELLGNRRVAWGTLSFRQGDSYESQRIQLKSRFSEPLGIGSVDYIVPITTAYDPLVIPPGTQFVFEPIGQTLHLRDKDGVELPEETIIDSINMEFLLIAPLQMVREVPDEFDDGDESRGQGLPEDDTFAPLPNPGIWALLPRAGGSYSIRMMAVPGRDPNGVEYYFECVLGGGNDSGWQDSPLYEDTGLLPETGYVYRFRMRDKSPNQNVGGGRRRSRRPRRTPLTSLRPSPIPRPGIRCPRPRARRPSR